METLLCEIKDSINKSVHTFIKNISKKYNLDEEELESIWNETEDVPQKVSRVQSSFPPQLSKPAQSKKESPKSFKGSEVEGCPYLFTKGEKKGEICGSNPKGDCVYCSRHKKYEGLSPKQKKTLPTPKKSVSSTIKSARKTSPESKTVDVILRKHRIIGQHWHSATGIVFNDEYVAIGKCENDKLVPLTEEDINTCKNYGFKLPVEVIKPEPEEENHSKIIRKVMLSKPDAKSKSPVAKSISSNIRNLSDKDDDDSLDEILSKSRVKKPDIVDDSNDIEDILEEMQEEEEEDEEDMNEMSRIDDEDEDLE